MLNLFNLVSACAVAVLGGYQKPYLDNHKEIRFNGNVSVNKVIDHFGYSYDTWSNISSFGQTGNVYYEFYDFDRNLSFYVNKINLYNNPLNNFATRFNTYTDPSYIRNYVYPISPLFTPQECDFMFITFYSVQSYRQYTDSNYTYHELTLTYYERFYFYRDTSYYASFYHEMGFDTGYYFVGGNRGLNIMQMNNNTDSDYYPFINIDYESFTGRYESLDQDSDSSIMADYYFKSLLGADYNSDVLSLYPVFLSSFPFGSDIKFTHVIEGNDNPSFYTDELVYYFTYYKSLNASYDDGYTDGYYNGYDDGYHLGNLDGYNQGSEVGYDDGYQEGFTYGEQTGYNTGYHDGLSSGSNYTFWSLFGAIADTPALMIRSLFDFDFFGVNLLSVVLSMFTAIVLFYIFRKII